jgi:hypothetical protein
MRDGFIESEVTISIGKNVPVKMERNLVTISSNTAAKSRFPMSDFIVIVVLMSVPSFHS